MENILDSGTRRDFGTGAVRDMAEGKGRMDLLPWDVLAYWFAKNLAWEEKKSEWCRWFLDDIHCAIKRVYTTEHIQDAITMFTNLAFDGNYLTAILEYAKHMEAGCLKYGDRNWENGIPVDVYLDSALRHFIKHVRGDDDERHDRAVLWNLWCCLWTIKHKPEMIDAPVGGAT